MALMPGRSSDPSPANCGAHKPVPALFTWVATAGAIAVAFVAARRTSSSRALFWTSLALGALLSMFPVYHRSYDRMLLLVPAVVELYTAGRTKLAWWLGPTATFGQGLSVPVRQTPETSA